MSRLLCQLSEISETCGEGAFDYLDLDSHLLLAEDGHNPHFDQLGGKMTLPHASTSQT